MEEGVITGWIMHQSCFHWHGKKKKETKACRKGRENSLPHCDVCHGVLWKRWKDSGFLQLIVLASVTKNNRVSGRRRLSVKLTQVDASGRRWYKWPVWVTSTTTLGIFRQRRNKRATTPCVRRNFDLVSLWKRCRLSFVFYFLITHKGLSI